MNVHYCMGERISASLLGSKKSAEEHKCPKCGMKKAASKKDCCKDEQVVLKASDDATLVKSALTFYAGFVALSPVATYAVESRPQFVSAMQAAPFRPHGPPPITGPRLHLRHCTFLI